eukprot:407678_1
MPPKKIKNTNYTLRSSNDANVGRKRPYSVIPDSMEAAVAKTPKPSKKVSTPSSKKSVSAEDQCDNPQSMSTNVAIPEPSGMTAPVCNHSNFNGSAIAETENKVSMTAGQEKFLQELEKLVKMGETTAASIHESATGIDSLDPNNNVEGNEAAYWKTRFEEMSNLRLTEPEKELETYRKHAEEKARAQDELIRELHRCNTEFSCDKLKLAAPAADDSIPTTQEVLSPNTNESGECDDLSLIILFKVFYFCSFSISVAVNFLICIFLF